MNVIRFLKDWTLPVSMGMGALLYLVFAYVPQLDGAALFFDPVMEAILPLFMFLILFVTFCKVDFHQMRPVWWHLWVSIFNLLFIGIVMALILSLPRAVANSCVPSVASDLRSSASLFTFHSTLILLEALLMCIISPCATAAAVVTQKLGGSLEQTTTFTFLSNFITVLMVPICFPLIEKGADISFMNAFLKILYQVVVLLVVPMLLAYIVKHTMHRFHQKIISIKDLSFYLWGCSLMIVTGTTVKNILHAEASVVFLGMIALLGLVLCIIQFAVGRFIGHFFGRAQEAGQALGQKNTAFAIWLGITYLNPLSSVGPGCYILWQNIINSFEIWQERQKNKGLKTLS
ncbi:transporter [Prevotella communis]|uniref:transporter n=1 Tax=Prevotella communis TaxID=2913614 RepID=UPI001EDB3DC1|nr:transporter [Prevotella communis]UKK55966.1 transporter [Prevotella communis]